MITIPATRARLTLLRLVHSNLPTAHIAAIQLIDDFEPAARGVYGGVVG